VPLASQLAPMASAQTVETVPHAVQARRDQQTIDVSSESTPEALHLRRLLEKQPGCLMRVGIDGLLLAANDAAVRLLGADTLAQVLGGKLTDRIIRRHQELWTDFADRIRGGTSGSFECDINDLAGNRRNILLQGVPLLDHADGIPSMILAARDTSTRRRLETALRSRDVSQELGELQQQLEGQVFAERSRSATPLVGRALDQQSAAKPAAGWAERQQALAEEHRLALLAKEHEAKQMMGVVRAELDRAVSERHQLEAALKERDIDHQRLLSESDSDRRRLVSEHAAELMKVQQTLLEEHQLAQLVKEREYGKLLDALRSELDQSQAMRARLATLLDERETEHQRLLEERSADGRLLDESRAEQQRLTMLLAQRESDFQGLAADAEADRVLAEQRLAEALREQAEIEKSLADARVELRSVDDNGRSLEWLAAAGRAAIEIARELETIVEAVDARTHHLLAQSSTGGPDRHVIEALRDDAIGAASLVRQIAQAAAAAQKFTEAGGNGGDARAN